MTLKSLESDWQLPQVKQEWQNAFFKQLAQGFKPWLSIWKSANTCSLVFQYYQKRSLTTVYWRHHVSGWLASWQVCLQHKLCEGKCLHTSDQLHRWYVYAEILFVKNSLGPAGLCALGHTFAFIAMQELCALKLAFYGHMRVMSFWQSVCSRGISSPSETALVNLWAPVFFNKSKI